MKFEKVFYLFKNTFNLLLLLLESQNYMNTSNNNKFEII